MSFEFAVATFIELFVVVLLIYGFMHEEKVILFEQNIKRIVKGNYRRFKRIRKQRKVAKHNGR